MGVQLDFAAAHPSVLILPYNVYGQVNWTGTSVGFHLREPLQPWFGQTICMAKTSDCVSKLRENINTLQ